MLQYLAILLLASTAYATTFSNCDGVPSIVSLEVPGCTEEPCYFVRGENIEARVRFTTPTATKTLQSTIRADALGLIVGFPLPEPDGCKGLTAAECPLVAQETATYVLEMPVLSAYPKISLRVEHTLTGDNGAISCFWLQGQVVDPEDLRDIRQQREQLALEQAHNDNNN